MRQQRNYKNNLSHVEIVAKHKNCYKADSNRPCRIGTEKGMECCDGRGQRSIDDVEECGAPKEKLAMSKFLCFLSITISIKLNLKWHNFVTYITIIILFAVF